MSQATSLNRGFPRAAAAMVLLFIIPATLAVTLLAATGAISPPIEVELADPGAVTHWGLPIAQALRDTAAAATIGALVTAAALLPGRAEALRMLGDAVHVRKTLDHTQHLMSLGVDEVRVRAGRVGLDDARHLVGLRRQGCADDRAAQG